MFRAEGLTLAETVVGLFVVSCGLLASFQLLQVSMQYSTRIDHRINATRIAERHLAEVRAWARQRDGANRYHFETHPVWTARYNGGWAADPLDGNYRFRIRNQAYDVDSPCSSLESVYPDSRKKRMTQSFHKVQVEVSWGSTSAERVSLVSLVGAPARPIPAGDSAIQISFTTRFQTPPLNYRERVEVEATLEDQWGRSIPDVMFSHYVRSVAVGGGLAGNGILDSAVTPRTGKTSTFLHDYPGYGRNWFAADGQVMVMVVARYRGLQRRNFTPYITLNP